MPATRTRRGERGDARGYPDHSCCRGGQFFGCTTITFAVGFAFAAVAQAQAADGPATAAPSLWDRSNLLADMAGLRTSLGDYGVTLNIVESSEILSNPVGGARQDVIYEGVTQFGLTADAGKLLGLDDATFSVSGFQVHGRGLSLNALGNNINTVSGLESLRGTLLYELWYEQGFFSHGLKIRIGQLAADQEFMISQASTLFMNHTFGWPSLPNADLPASGPASPLATSGIRLKWVPREDVALLLAAFNADPAGPGPGAPQLRDSSGTDFRLNDGVLAFAELQYSIHSGDKASGLPGTYKIGGWYNTGVFADQHLNEAGYSSADPAYRGLPALHHRGDFSLYAIADQTLLQPNKSLTVEGFVRIMAAPADRNLVGVYADAGIICKGLIAGRDNDTAGIGFAIAGISNDAAALDADTARFAGGRYPIRSSEKSLEFTYQAVIAPWWQMQASVQLVLDPGGGIADPAAPAQRLGNAVVLGLRTVITF